MAATAVLTAARGEKSDTVFRVIDLDPESDVIEVGQGLLLLDAYHDLEKHDAFYSIGLAGGELRRSTAP